MFYSVAKAIIAFIFHLLFRIDVTGMENIPENDGALICPNHYHWADPFLVAIIIPRPVRFMAKYELFKNPISRWFLTNVGGYPVKRGEADLNAIKNTFRLLKDKQLLGLFPEGTRIKGEELGKANAGVGMFSIKTGKPAIPVLVSGNYRLFSRMKVIIGEPVDFAAYKKDKMTNDDYLEVSQVIMEKINELKGREK